MQDQKLFRLAAGRLFRIQAVARDNQALTVLMRNLSQRDCEQWNPSRYDKKLYKNFRIAYDR